MFLALIYASLSWGFGNAGPIPVHRTSESTSFLMNDPDPATNRQILDIVWSCLAATISCTWVSVHVNIPFYREHGWTNRRRRLWLMLLSILTPDIVIMWAFIQMRGALDIKDRVNKIINKLNKTRPDHQKCEKACLSYS